MILHDTFAHILVGGFGLDASEEGCEACQAENMIRGDRQREVDAGEERLATLMDEGPVDRGTMHEEEDR